MITNFKFKTFLLILFIKLSIKDEYTFGFSNFLIIGLCNSSANSLFDIFSFLTETPEVFYQKKYKPLKLDLFDTHHILAFQQY